MTETRLTGNQRRAMAWLPSDGSWRTGPAPSASLHASLHSLYLAGLCDMEHGKFGKRGGTCARRRLSALGLAILRNGGGEQ